MAKAEIRTNEGVVVTRPTNRLPVQTAYLHQAIMIPNLLSTEKHLGKPTQKINLEWGPEGLWVLPIEDGKPTCIVPQANVANVVLK